MSDGDSIACQRCAKLIGMQVQGPIITVGSLPRYVCPVCWKIWGNKKRCDDENAVG